jgi:hypothetical protein
VKNLIMEKMRTPESNEDKGDDEKSKSNHENSSISAPGSHPSASSSHLSSQANHIGNLSTGNEHSSSSSIEPQRYPDPSQVSPTPV